MLKSAKLCKEISIIAKNKKGLLSDITKIVTDKGINIEGTAGYIKDKENAEIMLVTDDNLRAVEALQKKGFDTAKERSAIILDLINKAGALKQIGAVLEKNSIDIKYIYGTTPSSSCASARIILSTDNDEKALVAFKNEAI